MTERLKVRLLGAAAKRFRNIKILRLLLVSCLLLEICAYCFCEAQKQVEMKLDRAKLVWTAGRGLELSYDDTLVFSPYPEEITVHTPDGLKWPYRSTEGLPQIRLERKGKRQVLAFQLPVKGFKCLQTITAGPGDRFRFEWNYSQSQWAEGQAWSELGLRPTERFLAGATFLGVVNGKRIKGQIPMQAPAKTSHPFANVSEVEIYSIFGTVHIKVTKPITLYDYLNRPGGCFWLGFMDEPLPKGKRMSFAIEVELKPAQVKPYGLVLSGFRTPKKVDDGFFQVGLNIAREKGTTEKVRLVLQGISVDGKPFQISKDFLVSSKPSPAELSFRVKEPGRLRFSLAIFAMPGEKEVFKMRELSVRVLPLMTVLPNLSLYTSERQGAFLVRTSAGLKGNRIRFVAEGEGIKAEGLVKPGKRVSIAFELGNVRDGITNVICRLIDGDEELTRATVTIRKAPPKANEVKIDYATRGLIVDGLPFLPFGFYCVYPPGELSTEEATQGFRHIAPYHNIEAEANPEKVREYMDRCDAVGLKVHYDIRSIAPIEPSPEKWQRLEAQVEAFRDHPALLCWYLCDEPEVYGIPPERLEEAYKFVKELDPYHPIAMVFVSPSEAPDYMKGTDIMMADPYPIPGSHITEVSNWADQLNEAIGYGMPLWIVPQAFGGGEAWEREPSAQEERVMTYLALIHGATGIQYFIRRPPIDNPISPSLWNECRHLALEAQELAPALLSSQPRPEVESSVASVHTAAWRYADVITVLAANTENEPVLVRLKLKEPLSATAEVLFANRHIQVSEGVIEDMLDGFSTRAYRIPIGEAPKAMAEVHPENLTVNPSYEQFANVGTPDGCYVGVGKDKGASLFVDARAAVHGRHSLRVCTPAEGEGVHISPFPIPVQAGQRYRLSIFAKGLQDGLKIRFGMGALDAGIKEFTLTQQWSEYALEGKAIKDSRGQIGLALVSKGTAWFDLLQLVPVK